MRKLMIIRHAEKPVAGGAGGVDENGAPDPESLTPRGWQRAGGLVRLFKPRDGDAAVASLDVPAAIFASAPGDGSNSKRPIQTVAPLAAMLGQTVQTPFGKGGEAGLATMLQAMHGTALVSWQHERINALLNAYAPGLAGVPGGWPDARFDVVWIVDHADGALTFSQAFQMLLSGDTADPIA